MQFHRCRLCMHVCVSTFVKTAPTTLGGAGGKAYYPQPHDLKLTTETPPGHIRTRAVSGTSRPHRCTVPPTLFSWSTANRQLCALNTYMYHQLLATTRLLHRSATAVNCCTIYNDGTVNPLTPTGLDLCTHNCAVLYCDARQIYLSTVSCE